jgi:nitrite reductase/ring-hydroxylating ferredoxin subunit
LEIAGVILLSIAGWLGGTLVFRNQIGVDIRYAHAGKWKEEYIDHGDGEIKVASIDELKVNQMKLIHIRGKRVVVCRTEKGYAAFDDHCTHRGGSLAGGAMICGTVQCPWHGSQFDVHSGSMLAGPATKSISVYPVKEIDKMVCLILS